MNILYEDSDILVIDKPAGLSVLPDGWEKDSQYLVQLLEKQFGKIFIVHRLDKVTSGVLAFARTAEAHRALNMQLDSHETQKIYHAIAIGNPKWDEHIARHPLRVNVGHKHRTMVDDKNGKPSETRFKVLKRYPAHILLEAQLMTGRTHQIRVHAYALGYPLLGDVLYSAPETNLIARPALHAYSLTFTHPVTGEKISFTAPYPPDFESALNNL
ncbi:MAG TPA: RluA family pseudouridine synthase [Anaerolineales bacterium]|nr:RluA family pseudouridine synthase [Anaerolineales bacterium]